MSPLSPLSLTFVSLTFFLCLLVSLPSESEARTCVYGCLHKVIACKRKATLGVGDGASCCEQYFECFLNCKPNAEVLPPCTSPKKRGSWD